MKTFELPNNMACAITVHPVTESVVITESEEAGMSDFKKRANTYTMTAPQTFQLGKIIDAYQKIDNLEQQDMPLLDAAMVYAQTGGEVRLVKRTRFEYKNNHTRRFLFLKAILELEENKYVFGL